MPKVRSVLEYDAIPFNQLDLSTPVTQIVEMNDGYQIVVAGELRDRIHDSDTQDERGGIQVNEFDSFRDFLLEECGAEEGENGQLVFEDNENLSMVLARMTEDGDPFMGGGALQLKKLSGSYRDPETLFMSFFDGDAEDDDDEVLCEEDCA